MYHKLSRGERLRLSRLRDGSTQDQMASYHGISVKAYGRMERDQADSSELETPRLGRLKIHEKLMLERSRAGLTQAQMAELLGCSRWWYNKMEQGLTSKESLRRYWKRL